MPEGMKLETRREFDRWYADHVARHVAFDFAKELIPYCESDVKLFKQACLTIKRDFESRADFDPIEQMAIASAWRPLPTNPSWDGEVKSTIPRFPWNGWRGATTV